MTVFEGFCAFYKNSSVCQIGEDETSITVSVVAMYVVFYSPVRRGGGRQAKMNSF